VSKDETTRPAPRILIGPATEPNPPWTGLYFVCEHCGGKFQLGCADECELITDATPKTVNLSLDAIRAETAGTGAELWLTPPCWTCELRNVIRTPIFQPEGNPS